MLNKVQKAAFDLIQSDARFIYTLVDMQNNAKNINSNYVMMSIPYIGIFADGAEQWCKKIGLNAPRFNDEEKEYYILNNTFKEIEDITDVHQMTNQQLKRLIQKIEVDKEGNVDIYLRLLGDLGLDESVLIEENKTVLNCNDQT